MAMLLALARGRLDMTSSLSTSPSLAWFIAGSCVFALACSKPADSAAETKLDNTEAQQEQEQEQEQASKPKSKSAVLEFNRDATLFKAELASIDRSLESLQPLVEDVGSDTHVAETKKNCRQVTTCLLIAMKCHNINILDFYFIHYVLTEC